MAMSTKGSFRVEERTSMPRPTRAPRIDVTMAITAGRTTMISKSGPVSMIPIVASCAAAYKAIDAEQTTEMVEIPTSARTANSLTHEGGGDPTRLIVTNARRRLRRSGLFVAGLRWWSRSLPH